MRFWLVAVVAAMPSVLVGQQLPRVVAQAEALGARTGVAVRDVDGKALYLHRGGDPFVPASNLKVLSAAAVLQGLGGEFRFSTPWQLRQGRLVVTASGDPNWLANTADAPATVFGAVVTALQRAGIKSIRGIDLAEGTFTGPSRPSTWPADQLDTYYCAPTGPFVLEQGTFVLSLRAGAANAEVAIASPPVGLPIRGTVPMVDARKGATYGAIDLGDAVKVNGKFWRKSSPVTIRTAVREPMTWFRAALEHALTQGGIAIDPAAPASEVALAPYQSELRPALLRILQDSSNFDAEQCLRVLGAVTLGDGSLRGGLLAFERQLTALVGNLPPGVVLLDGSGLSRDNRITPALVVETLATVLRGPHKDLYVACLPVAGESGTLERRFDKSPVAGRVFAKTGWIRGASALSGVLRRQDGGLRLFSILMNYDRDKNGLNKQLKDLQESIVEAIDALPVGGS
ncbi:MAG: D-alanyl-D-alanine carboxypeptidase/D-alanyl-D-alanine-endopeptidase [Planctomycetes bacterium]|nr:D-alanyl-D-alanine carboxypeptidase/D-alanyl-D-alanine-endopeptidase [Planctomycetota bacterium]